MPVLKTTNPDGTPYTPSLEAQRAKKHSLRGSVREQNTTAVNTKAKQSNSKKPSNG